MKCEFRMTNYKFVKGSKMTIHFTIPNSKFVIQ